MLYFRFRLKDCQALNLGMWIKASQWDWLLRYLLGKANNSLQLLLVDEFNKPNQILQIGEKVSTGFSVKTLNLIGWRGRSQQVLKSIARITRWCFNLKYSLQTHRGLDIVPREITITSEGRLKRGRLVITIEEFTEYKSQRSPSDRIMLGEQCVTPGLLQFQKQLIRTKQWKLDSTGEGATPRKF